MKPLFFCLSFSLLQWLAAQSHSYTITDNSVIIYHGYHPFHNWSGVSHAVSGNIEASPKNPATFSCSVQVSLKSFDSGSISRGSAQKPRPDATKWAPNATPTIRQP